MNFNPVTDIMIDTEFLSFKYDSYLMSIGVVAWDITEPDFKVVDQVHIFPDMDSQTEFGAKMDRDTLMWWLNQSEQARVSIISGQKKTLGSMRNCLTSLSTRILEWGFSVERIWSHGECCDLPLLKHWYDKLNLTVPWRYQQPRDTYTLFEVVNHTPEKKFHGGVAHDALADATAQAEQVHEAWKLRRV